MGTTTGFSLLWNLSSNKNGWIYWAHQSSQSEEMSAAATEKVNDLGPRTNADMSIRTNAETWYKSTNADNFCPKGLTPTIHTD
jgi:hypothetical protein